MDKKEGFIFTLQYTGSEKLADGILSLFQSVCELLYNTLGVQLTCLGYIKQPVEEDIQEGGDG